MLTNRPDRKPDLTIKNIQIDVERCVVEYELYYEQSGRVVDWVIPQNTTFEPPKDFEDGTSWAVWTEDIGPNKKKDYDWVWIEPMSTYARSTQSSLTRKLKHKVIHQQLDDLQNNFNTLFDLVRKSIDE